MSTEGFSCSVPDTPESLCNTNGSMIPGRPVALFGLSAKDELPSAVRCYLEAGRIPFRVIPVASSGYFTFFEACSVSSGEANVMAALDQTYGSPTHPVGPHGSL